MNATTNKDRAEFVKIAQFEQDEDVVEQKRDLTSFYRQLVVVTVIFIDIITNGVLIGYSVTLIPELQADDSVFEITKPQAVWIAAIAVLPLAPSCALGGWTLEKFGRKSTYILATMLNTFGWLLIAMSPNVYCLLVGRFVTGIASGLTTAVGNVYSGEIATPHYRTVFLGLPIIGLSIGPLLVHIFALYFTWKTTAACVAITAFISFLVALQTRESYVWYLRHGNLDAATASFHYYRGYDAEARNELNKVLKDHLAVEPTRRHSFKELWSLLTSRKFLKPLLITNVFFLTSQWSGNKAVLFYSVNILKRIIPHMNEYYNTIMLDTIRLIASCFSIVLINRCQVRTLTMVSGFGAAISLFLLAGFSYYSNEYSDNVYYNYMTLVALLAYIGIVSVGLLPLPFVIYGELYPKNAKGIGAGSTLFVYMFMLFVIVRASPEMFDALGISGGFIVFASFAFLGTLTLYFILPETKNKTLYEIEKNFGRRNSRDILDSSM